MFVQAEALHISDDQRPLADQRTYFQPMETTELAAGPDVMEELDDSPMDAACDDFVTAAALPVAEASLSSAHLRSY